MPSNFIKEIVDYLLSTKMAGGSIIAAFRIYLQVNDLRATPSDIRAVNERLRSCS